MSKCHIEAIYEYVDILFYVKVVDCCFWPSKPASMTKVMKAVLGNSDGLLKVHMPGFSNPPFYVAYGVRLLENLEPIASSSADDY